ncbi:WhiB family transcriptional regulator [Streptomyces chrestomyceticus]|uniref:WhiB family transcriptional regulator n=1 Tax=Streptomyces chrestomyceticus TaxID=68185 RepID=UPI0033DD6DAD
MLGELGACATFKFGERAEDPELFFPVGDTGSALAQVGVAKAVCRRCPVMGTCQDWALTTGEEWGVWGGLSEEERRNIRRRWALVERAGR